MAIRIGNAPCSWGVEFAFDANNPPWQLVLDQCAAAGYAGIELGPVGFMPEDPMVLSDALAQRRLQLIGGVVFRPFHDPNQWHEVLDATHRTCKALSGQNARHLVLIDSISPRRAKSAGRVDEAEQMDQADWARFVERIRTVSKIGAYDYDLDVSIHAHAGGFMDFEPELEQLLQEVDENLLKICLDSGHHSYAGFDPLVFIRRYIERISYVHFKDIDSAVKARVISNRTGFYQACAEGIFCNLGCGEVDFINLRLVLEEVNFDGWCTIEQDCDPTMNDTIYQTACANLAYLRSIGFE